MKQQQQVLIAGGGVAALEAALALQALAGELVSVQLLGPEPHFWYRPLAVAEPFGITKVRRFDLSMLADEAGSLFVPGKLVAVDADRRVALTEPAGEVAYDALLVACGAVPMPAIPGAINFRGPADTSKIDQLLAEIDDGEVRRVAFVVPPGAVWSLPAYELALMTGSRLAARNRTDVELTLVTPEEEPLHVFGRDASDAVRELLDERGIAFRPRSYPVKAGPGELVLLPDEVVGADRVVALPRLQGPRIGGLPQTFEGFIPVDPHGRVTGLCDVYAAGDITTFTVKQGGIAAQQADVAAQAIAAAAGAEVTPRPFQPVLRGLLVTGGIPSYLRADLTGDADRTSQASIVPLWWPPAKIVGRYLAPFLGRLDEAIPGGPAVDEAVPVEIELDASVSEHRRDRLLADTVDRATADPAAARVGDAMSIDTLVVAPEDTLGEVAEEMCRRDAGCALVAEYGRLIGILTSRDVLRAIAGRVHSSEARVRQWMTAEPITVSPETTLAAARIVAAEHGVHHLPVVDSDRLVGMVIVRDLESGAAESAGALAATSPRG